MNNNVRINYYIFMEQFFSESQDRQDRVFQLMTMMGIDNIDVAYFLLKDADWNIQNAVSGFLDQVPAAPVLNPQPSFEQQQDFYNDLDFPQQLTFQQKKKAFDDMFPQLSLEKQVTNQNYQKLKKIRRSSNLDQQLLKKIVDKLQQNKVFGQRIRQSSRAIKHNKNFIMFLNEHHKTKIRFSFGTFYSNLALSFLRKKPLLVYVHNEQTLSGKLLSALLQDQEITGYINKNFVIYGIFDNSNDYDLISKNLPITQLPGVVCYSYDDKKNTHAYLGGHKLIEKDPLTILKFLQMIVQKYKQNNPIPKEQKSQIKQQQKKQKKKQEKSEVHQNRHSVIDEQNELYQKMQQQYKLKRQISRLNKQQIEAKKQNIAKIKAQFEKQPQGEDVVSFVFRLPLGTSLKRKFNLTDKIDALFLYVYSFGSQSFQNQYGQFDLVQTYPPLNLSQKKSLKINEVFQDSNHQNLIVKEK